MGFAEPLDRWTLTDPFGSNNKLSTIDLFLMYVYCLNGDYCSRHYRFGFVVLGIVCSAIIREALQGSTANFCPPVSDRHAPCMRPAYSRTTYGLFDGIYIAGYHQAQFVALLISHLAGDHQSGNRLTNLRSWSPPAQY